MAVKIRLSRTGKKHAPFYRIVAVDGRKKRDGAFLEDLGTYDAIKSTVVRLEQDRMNYWLSVGAVPTDVIKKIHKKYTQSKTEASQEKTSTTKSKAPSKKIKKTEPATE